VSSRKRDFGGAEVSALRVSVLGVSVLGVSALVSEWPAPTPAPE
jgi:hypothetical protein